MLIHVKCFATLARKSPPDGTLDLPEGADVAEAMQRLGIAPDDVKILFVNGVHVTPQARLAEGDQLGLFPAVGGG
jgi:sulfur carrier protein ThiS